MFGIIRLGRGGRIWLAAFPGTTRQVAYRSATTVCVGLCVLGGCLRAVLRVVSSPSWCLDTWWIIASTDLSRTDCDSTTSTVCKILVVEWFECELEVVVARQFRASQFSCVCRLLFSMDFHSARCLVLSRPLSDNEFPRVFLLAHHLPYAATWQKCIHTACRIYHGILPSWLLP